MWTNNLYYVNGASKISIYFVILLINNPTNFSGMYLHSTFIAAFFFAYINLSNQEQNFTTSAQRELNKYKADQLNQFVMEITDVYFEKNKILHLFLPYYDQGIHKSSMEEINYETIINKQNSKFQMLISKYNKREKLITVPHIKPSYYVIYINRNVAVNETSSGWKLLRQYKESWNPRAYFIFVVLQQETVYDDDNILAIIVLNSLWKINIYKTVLLFRNFNGCNQTKLITASPFNGKICRLLRSTNDLSFLDLSVNQSLRIPLFNYKPHMDFQGCTMIAETFTYPPFSISNIHNIYATWQINITKHLYASGIEFKLLCLLAEKFNVKLEYKTNDLSNNHWYEFTPDGRPVGMVEDILMYDTDFAFAGTVPTHFIYFLAEYSRWHSFDSFTWFVPDPNPIPQWKIVFIVFETNIWLMIINTFVIFSILFYVFSKFKFDKKNNTFCSLSYHIMMMYSSMLGVSIPFPPKLNNLRFLFLAWSIYSLHISAIYQQNMYSLMMNPIMEGEINSLHELKQSGLKTCVNKLYYDLLIQVFNTSGELNTYIICNNQLKIITNIMANKNISLLEKRMNTDFTGRLYHNQLRKLPEVFISYPVSILMTKAHVALEGLNMLIQRVVESGLLKKWTQDLFLMVPKADMHQDMEDLSSPKVLGLYDLQCAFFIWIFGIIFSILMFILEIISKYLFVN